ncbi:MAG: flavodoxin family protein [Spirochaetaceae bacterium]|nr:MAG: flavodoxin family protein [Spirochaetaceae bacterium]
MATLVLFGLGADDPLSSTVAEELKSQLPESLDAAWFDLPAMSIGYCNGCGYCGDTNPGICCKRDQMQEIYPHLARAARIVLVSLVRFGGFGGHLKKAIDRFSPQGLGTYVLHNGEMHHEMRYPGPASVISIGIMRREDEAEEKTFHLAGSRIAACVFAERSASTVLAPGMAGEEVRSRIENSFREAGASR